MLNIMNKQNYLTGLLTRVGAVALAAVTTMGLSGGMANAASTVQVQWNSPANNSTYLVGTNVTPTGTASGFATGGAGLDLALVLDASSSMGRLAFSGGVNKTRAQWQAEAAVALVNSLPTNSTAVALIKFGTVSGTSVVLPLTPTTQAADIVAAINSIVANQGSTAIGTGIATAQTELLGVNATSGASKQMVVISDGENNAGVNPVTAAGTANSNGIIVHGVSIPGGNTAQMQSIATEGGGTFFNASTDQGLQNLLSLFSGSGGTIVGVDKVEVILPDGTSVPNALTDAFGNFSVNWNIGLGDNLFRAIATFTDGSTLEANLNLIGVEANPIPLPAAGWLLLSGLAGLGIARRARRRP